jgi:hypothetical protein
MVVLVDNNGNVLTPAQKTLPKDLQNAIKKSKSKKKNS